MSSHPVAPPTTAKMAMTTMLKSMNSPCLPVGLPRSESAITTVVEPVRRLQPVYALLAELGVVEILERERNL